MKARHSITCHTLVIIVYPPICIHFYVCQKKSVFLRKEHLLIR